MIRLIYVFFFLFSMQIKAGDLDVYEMAKKVAKETEEYYKNTPSMDVELSRKAFPSGKGVVNEIVLAFRKDAGESLVRVWRAGTRSEIYPKACALIKSFPVYEEGFYLRYRYLRSDGFLLDDILVNKSSCDGLY